MQKSLAKFSLALHVTSFSLSVLLLTIAANQSVRMNSDSYCKKKKQMDCIFSWSVPLLITEMMP